LRIAEICPPWIAVPPKGYGGIEWVVALLADGLAEAGHDVTLFATGDSQTKARLEYVFEQAPGSAAINDIVLDTTHTLFSLTDAAERFDVLHVHSPFSALAAAVGDRGADRPHPPRVVRAGDDAVVLVRRATRLVRRDQRGAEAVQRGSALRRRRLQRHRHGAPIPCRRTRRTSSCSSVVRPPEKGWRRAVEAAIAAVSASCPP
jgi:glycosyltransferase involved in cell wall biosynthesis